MKEITRLRFDSLAGYVRHPMALLKVEELEWYESGKERLLAFVGRDLGDNDFGYTILGRDRLKRFRAIDFEHSFPNRKKARNALKVGMAKWLKQRTDKFYQNDEKGDPVDFFRPVVKPEKLNRAFRELSTRGTHPSSKLIEEMMHWYEDVDGNFLEQFQTSAFDARLWELYLFALFIELGYAFDRSFQAPDFICVGLRGKFVVEATTVNESSPPANISEMSEEEYYRNYVPMKYGSALFSKLKKKYWEQEHVKGLPLVFAIQDFHGFQTMSWSISALTEYLFGAVNTKRLNEAGGIENATERIVEYKYKDKIVPAGFFYQPEAENISAVIANPGGTISKFDRMAYLAGFREGNITLLRQGMCFRNSDIQEPFVSRVDSPDYSETWVEGLSVFHNPNAKHPLPDYYLPGAAHYHWENEEIISYMPPFHPTGSVTFNLVSVENIPAGREKPDLNEIITKFTPKKNSV